MGCPLFGSNSGLFTVPSFIVSLVGIKKKNEEGRRDKKGKREGIEQERGKRGKRCYKKKIIKMIIIKNFLKIKNK